MEHNGADVQVSIQDRAWLRAFASRDIDIREGDILRGIATMEQHYTAKGKLLHAEIYITSVVETVDPEDARKSAGHPQPGGDDTLGTVVTSPPSPAMSMSFSIPVVDRAPRPGIT
jgi:hypothetical protein